jgi:DNA polymerase-3 subunit gamma/tau
VSYLAIARKYRPTTFDEIVGQEHVTRTLKNAITRNRIHHAFLFCGARGVGKTTAARALAQALNCTNGPTPEPCGSCTCCVEIRAGTCPDLIEIDGASNNSVDDIRDLRDTVKYAPTQGSYKIYLVDEVHMLSKAAFNALLKTLEEPPPHVVFLFATTEPNKIPDTILSRVQRFDFLRIPSTAVVTRLASIAQAEGATISENALRLIAHAGEGSMRDSQSLLDKVIAFAGPEITDEEVAETLGLIDRTLLYLMLEGLVNGAPEKCLQAIDQVYGYGFELSQFTTEMLEITRNATFLQLSEASHRYVDLSNEEKEELLSIVNGVTPQVLTRTFTTLLEIHDQVARANRPRIVLEMAVARLATTRPLQPIGEMVQRLQELERQLRLHGGTPPIRPMTQNSTSSRSRSPRRQASKSSSSGDDDSSSGATRAGPAEKVQIKPVEPTPKTTVKTAASKPKSPEAPNRPAEMPAEAPKPVAEVRPPEQERSNTTKPSSPPVEQEFAPVQQKAPPIKQEVAPATASSEPVVPSDKNKASTKKPEAKSGFQAPTPPRTSTKHNLSQLKKSLAANGKIGAAIAEAEWTLIDQSIRIPMTGAVLVARARRLIKLPELATTIRAVIGSSHTLEIVELPSKQASSEEEAVLQQQFLSDIRIQRMMTLFDAKLIDVEKGN